MKHPLNALTNVLRRSGEATSPFQSLRIRLFCLRTQPEIGMIAQSDFSMKFHPTATTTDLDMFGPVRPDRTLNSKRAIEFSARQAPGLWPAVRDRLSRVARSRCTPKKRLGFFNFLTRHRWEMVTHNPPVPGSSPGGPTIPYRSHCLIDSRPGNRVDWRKTLAGGDAFGASGCGSQTPVSARMARKPATASRRVTQVA
jgi:hypothetical protein